MKPVFDLVFSTAVPLTILMIVVFVFKAHFFEKKEEQINFQRLQESVLRNRLAKMLRGYFLFGVFFMVFLHLFVNNFENVFFQDYFDWKVFLLIIIFTLMLFCGIGGLVSILNLIFSTYESIVETIEDAEEELPE